MAILRFTASQDTTISNAFKENLSTRATGSNMGSSDVLEVFNIYAQASTSSSEKSRALVKFPLANIISKRSGGNVPASGSVNWYLRLFNVEHSETLPEEFTMVAAAVSQSWDEGYGLDMDGYSDPGLGNAGYGVTWDARTTGSVSQGSLELDGDADYVTVADAADLSFGDGDDDSAFSISAWIYMDNIDNDGPILSKYTTTTSDRREWYFYVRSGGNDYLEMILYDETANVSAVARTPASSIADDTWYHVVMTYDGTAGATAASGIKIYIDGTSQTLTVSNDASYDSMLDTTAPVYIGYVTEGPSFFDGKLDEISVWNKELSQGEVTDVYNSGCPIDLRFHSVYKSDATDLIAWWRFETANVATVDTTTTIQDNSDNSHSGTGTSLVAGSLSTTTPGTCTDTTLYWVTAGGQFSTAAGFTYSQYFRKGTEDLEIDISHAVEEWIKYENNSSTGTPNYGMGIRLHGDQEDATRGYYTKRFSGRGSEFFFKRPVLEARWDDSKKDHSGRFYLSSSLLPAADNINTIYLYNVVKGELKNVPNLAATGEIWVSLYSGSATNAAPSGSRLKLPAGGGVVTDGHQIVTGGYVSTGIYSASFAYASSSITVVYPVWHSSSTEYHTGSATTVKTFKSSNYNPKPLHVSKITNLKSNYSTIETARFRLHIREKDWNPTIYSKASTDIENKVIEDAYYKVLRVVDDYEVIGYGTGSTNHTRLSYDISGSYFDLEMNMFEVDYMYGIKLIYKINGEYAEQSEVFKFRVE